MELFADRLVAAIKAKKSVVVVGLDPRLENLPQDYQRGTKDDIERAGRAILEFNQAVIDLVQDHCVAVKPQIAFYERLGPFGMATYFGTCLYAHQKNLLVIADVKRGDVPETAKAYAEAHRDAFPCDALTVNPLFGTDGMQPFLDSAKSHGLGVFTLVKTSNPSSAEIQDLRVEGKPLYLHVARLVARWGEESIGACGYSSIGAVVGATHPDQAREIRAALPRAFFLVPGYGVQGGRAEDVIACFNPDGLGAVVSASRSIIFAYEREPYRRRYGQEKWERAVREAVEAMNAEINATIKPR